ncbi:hypothetical protein [Stenotrophomonas maltophilia]|uniref:hypothetical protein n=1 Tax=Stenotrophomonas maltophilia TaxID=40324 RepID=UPI00117D5356|nr:hypothetical protein [Stenotrophomonas maltophilia]
METIEMHGLTFKVEHHPDYDAGAPWENVDILGEVDDGRRSKRPGERVINDRDGRNGWRRFHDFAGAVAKARAEGLSGPDAAEAAEREFNWLKAWCEDRWSYIGVEVTLLDAEGTQDDRGHLREGPGGSQALRPACLRGGPFGPSIPRQGDMRDREKPETGTSNATTTVASL